MRLCKREGRSLFYCRLSTCKPLFSIRLTTILVSNLVIEQLIECNALCLHQNVFQQDIFDCNVYGSDKTVNDFRQ